MDKKELENLILKAIQEERFSNLSTNFEIINFITCEIINDSSFIINLRNELLRSKIELNSYYKQKEFKEKIKKSMNIIIEPNLLKRFEEALELVHEEIIKLINQIRIGQMVKIMTQQKGF